LLELSDKLQVHHRSRIDIAQLGIALGKFLGNEIEAFGGRHRDLAVQTPGGIESGSHHLAILETRVAGDNRQ